MNKKVIVWVGIIIVILVVVFILIIKNGNKSINNNVVNKIDNAGSANKGEEIVKEFSMTSFVDMSSGSPKPQFSLKEITVNKGDKVKIKITVTSGMHDFKIDEYGVYANTELGKETTVEFVADKVGEFVYYCTKPGHRQNGQWGTLKVLE
jgi:nitrous oxide reductase